MSKGPNTQTSCRRFGACSPETMEKHPRCPSVFVCCHVETKNSFQGKKKKHQESHCFSARDKKKKTCPKDQRLDPLMKGWMNESLHGGGVICPPRWKRRKSPLPWFPPARWPIEILLLAFSQMGCWTRITNILLWRASTKKKVLREKTPGKTTKKTVYLKENRSFHVWERWKKSVTMLGKCLV